MKARTLVKIRRRIWILKAMLTSQLSAWVDFGMSFATFAWMGFNAMYAAAAGAISGGIVNCALNYKWTFRASNCPVVNVMIKYAMIWVGSLLLNTYGTEWLNQAFDQSAVLDAWGVVRNLRFTVARLTVSLIVSLFWNLLFQRIFVYRNVGFDNFLNRCLHRQTV